MNLLEKEEAMSDRIRKARRKAGMRQADLADRIGVSTATVGQYESGASNPSVEKLSRIADVCEVTTDWLINGSDVAGPHSDEIEEMLWSRIEKMEEAFRRKEEKYLEIIKNLSLGKDKVMAGAAKLLGISNEVSSGCFATMTGQRIAVPTA